MHLQLNNLIILSQAFVSLCPPSSSRPSAIKITAAVRGNPTFRLLAEKDEKFGHEGPVFVEEQNKMYFSSNVLSREGSRASKSVESTLKQESLKHSIEYLERYQWSMVDFGRQTVRSSSAPKDILTQLGDCTHWT